MKYVVRWILLFCFSSVSAQRLPVASCSQSFSYTRQLVKLKVWKDSIVCVTHNAAYLLKAVEELDPYLCDEMKYVRENNLKKYTVFLEIDSLTPFNMVDHVMEELEHHYCSNYIFLFSDRKGGPGGFNLNWRPSPLGIDLNPEIVKLYGKRYETGEDCLQKKKEKKQEQNDIPPPPPYEITSHVQNYIDSRNRGTASEISLIQMNETEYALDGKKMSRDSLFTYLGSHPERIYLLKCTKDNKYHELISMVELMFLTQSYKFLILSLAEQEYMRTRLKVN
jgi:hypothetical protein